jgi:5-methylcytosine-specific restriction endonuclease McrA
MKKKTCTKCGETKPLEEFHRESRGRYGRRSRCKVCVNAQKKTWREANPEKVRAAFKAWREADPEREYARHKAYREANPEKKRAAFKAWREANPDKERARKKAWREANPEKSRAACRRSRARKRLLEESFTPEQEARVLEVFQGQCFKCGSTDELHVDHYLPLSKGNPLRSGNAIILCKSCNSSKRTRPASKFFEPAEQSAVEAILVREARHAGEPPPFFEQAPLFRDVKHHPGV